MVRASVCGALYLRRRAERPALCSAGPARQVRQRDAPAASPQSDRATGAASSRSPPLDVQHGELAAQDVKQEQKQPRDLEVAHQPAASAASALPPSHSGQQPQQSQQQLLQPLQPLQPMQQHECTLIGQTLLSLCNRVRSDATRWRKIAIDREQELLSAHKRADVSWPRIPRLLSLMLNRAVCCCRRGQAAIGQMGELQQRLKLIKTKCKEAATALRQCTDDNRELKVSERAIWLC